MARKKSLDLGPVLRTQILEAASQLFYERGYAATSIRDVADHVGISSSTMYHHFANKQDVLNAVVTRFMDDFNAATLPIIEDTSRDPLERIRSVIRVHIELSEERRPELLVGNPVRYALDATQRAHVIGQQAHYNTALRRLIDEGCAAGVFHVDDAGLATMALLDMLNGVREWYRHDGRLSLDAVIDKYTEFAQRILGVETREASA